MEIKRLPIILMSLISESSNRSMEWTKNTRSCSLESEACARISICESRLEALSGRIEQFLGHVVDNGYTSIPLDVGVIVSISNRVDTL